MGRKREREARCNGVKETGGEKKRVRRGEREVKDSKGLKRKGREESYGKRREREAGYNEVKENGRGK